jgi:hypothetical protein
VVIGGRKKHASQVAVCPPSYVPRHQAQSILKTQVFKKQCKRFCKKKQSNALKEKIAFKKIKHRLKRKSAKGILQKKHAKLSAKRNLCK